MLCSPSPVVQEGWTGAVLCACRGGTSQGISGFVSEGLWPSLVGFPREIKAGGSPFLGCAWKGCPGGTAAAVWRRREVALCQRGLLSSVRGSLCHSRDSCLGLEQSVGLDFVPGVASSCLW